MDSIKTIAKKQIVILVIVFVISIVITALTLASCPKGDICCKYEDHGKYEHICTDKEFCDYLVGTPTNPSKCTE